MKKIDNVEDYICSHCTGMSWYSPFGRLRLTVRGNAFNLSSANANSIELVTPSGGSISNGAPIDSCRDRAPTILALSNRVSLGGPMRTLV